MIIDLICRSGIEKMIDQRVGAMEKRINDIDLQLHALREEKKVKKYFEQKEFKKYFNGTNKQKEVRN